MIIKTIAIGNSNEGYVETAIDDKCNIISSDDNNKGKTIVLQGAMYALGNVPAFPASFNFEDYYYIVEIFVNEKSFWICRKNNEFIILHNGSLFLFETVSEMKRYWTKNIYKMPIMVKNNMQRIVDPELFLQLFFVGQDKKDTSNICNKGFYNKNDFYNMLYSYMGMGVSVLDQNQLDRAKEKITALKEEKATLTKQHKILKSKKKSSTYLSSISDLNAFEKMVKEMERVQEKITELQKSRNLFATRKTRWEKTIKELNSLNRSIETGELRCMDCDSTNIMYKGNKKDSFSFDVSNIEMRKQIITSIKEKVSAYVEEIQKLTAQINQQQVVLQELLAEEDVSLETLVAYKSQVMDASDAEKRINEIVLEIKELETKITITESGVTNQKEQQETLKQSILNVMYDFYKLVDPNGNLTFTDLFSKSGVVFSGSDATMFYLAKMYAFAKILNHTFPIIIDSFRAEDLSSGKEQVVLEEFKKLGNQLIFTTTLKKEEKGKYDNVNGVNHIDYSSHTPSKILEVKYGDKITSLLQQFAL